MLSPVAEHALVGTAFGPVVDLLTSAFFNIDFSNTVALIEKVKTDTNAAQKISDIVTIADSILNKVTQHNPAALVPVAPPTPAAA